MIVDIWQWAPFVTLILLAGMQGISPEVIEAARLDRVRGPAYVCRIVLPLIWPVVTVVLQLRLVDEIRLFDAIFVVTRGGPGSSTLLASVNRQRQSGRRMPAVSPRDGGAVLFRVLIVVFAVRSDERVGACTSPREPSPDTSGGEN